MFRLGKPTPSWSLIAFSTLSSALRLKTSGQSYAYTTSNGYSLRNLNEAHALMLCSLPLALLVRYHQLQDFRQLLVDITDRGGVTPGFLHREDAHVSEYVKKERRRRALRRTGIFMKSLHILLTTPCSEVLMPSSSSPGARHLTPNP